MGILKTFRFYCLFIFHIYFIFFAGLAQAASQIPPIGIIYNIEDQPTEKNSVSQIIQSQLAAKGITVKVEPLSNTIFNEKLGKMDYSLGFSSWYIDYNDPEGFLTDFYSKASFRMSKYNNPEFDKLYLQGITASDEKKKFELFRQASELLKNDLPWIPLYSNSEIFIFNKKAGGFYSDPYQYYDYKRVDMSNMRVSSDIAPQTLDPALTYDVASKHIVYQSYEGLVTMDEKGNPSPSLAYEWTFSKNKDSLTFKLRKDVYFHDSPVFSNKKGRVMTAEDVKFSFERMLKSNSPYSYIFDHVKGVEDFKSGKNKNVIGFRVVDPYTFLIELNKPFLTQLPWLLAPAAYIIPKETPKDYDFTRGSVGTGPFALESFDGSTAKFHAFAGYWQHDAGKKPLPYAKTLSIRIMLDANLAWTAFLQNELDIFNVPLSLFNELYDSEGKVKPKWSQYGYRETPLQNIKFLFFNMEKEPLGKQVELRKKIGAAIDRQSIVKWIFKGKAREANSVIPSGVKGF